MRRRVRFVFATAAFLATLSSATSTPRAAEPRRVAVAFFGTPDSAAERGARLGIDEASRQARYFGFVFELRPASENTGVAISAQRDPALLETLTTDGSDGEGLRLVVNALDPVRGACREGLFHIAPSAAMVEDALAQWRAGGGADDVRVEAWHPSLVKFAARDLNKRFFERFGESMGSEAWGGWAAARSIGEAVLRTRSDDPARLAAYLEAEFGLDGQKGRALTFRPNRQLGQPLYVVDASDRVVGEAPFAEPGAERNLDSLGVLRCTAASTAD